VGELMARVRANIRRKHVLGEANHEASVFNFGDVSIDQAARIVKRRNIEVHLTPIEYRLLNQLMRNVGRVLTHRHLLREVWGLSHADSSHYLRVYMSHLRQKLEDDPAQPKHILTETAVGYRLVV
jgi:two-component system, OmpR family, KDP operon response regulator KdpE